MSAIPRKDGPLVKILMALCVLVAVVALSLLPLPITFSVVAVTQSLTLSPAESHRALWNFPTARLYPLDSGGEFEFSGSLRVKPGTRVTFERIGQGRLSMQVVKTGSQQTLAEVYDLESGSFLRNLDEEFAIEAGTPQTADGQSYNSVFAINGAVAVGQSVGNEIHDPATLLLEGTISMLAHTLLDQRLYQAGSTGLEVGDYLDLQQKDNAHGLLLFGRDEHIKAVFRVKTRQLHVSRYNSLGYDLYASPLVKIQHDHVLQGIWLACLFVLGWIARWKTQTPESS